MISPITTEVIEYLKENLRIEVRVDTEGFDLVVKTTLSIEGNTISESRDSIKLPNSNEF